jgi:hypothetical protein
MQAYRADQGLSRKGGAAEVVEAWMRGAARDAKGLEEPTGCVKHRRVAWFLAPRNGRIGRARPAGVGPQDTATSGETPPGFGRHLRTRVLPGAQVGETASAASSSAGVETIASGPAVRRRSSAWTPPQVTAIERRPAAFAAWTSKGESPT